MEAVPADILRAAIAAHRHAPEIPLETIARAAIGLVEVGNSGDIPPDQVILNMARALSTLTDPPIP